MKHIATIVGIVCCLYLSIASADVALTGNCQDDIRKLQDEMEENKDRYTADSRVKANAEIATAKTNLINPVKCRKNLMQARDHLRKGKHEKKDKEKD